MDGKIYEESKRNGRRSALERDGGKSGGWPSGGGDGQWGLQKLLMSTGHSPDKLLKIQMFPHLYRKYSINNMVNY